MLKGQLKYLALPFFLIGVLLIVFLQFTSGLSINQLIDGNRRVLDDLFIQTELKKLETDVVSLESNIRGAVITENPIHLQDIDDLISSIQLELDTLNLLIVEPGNKQMMNDLTKLIKSKIAFSDTILHTFRTNGKPAAEAVINTGRGKSIRDQIVVLIARLEGNRRTDVSQLIDKIDASGARARNWGLVLALIAGVTCVVAFWHFVSQGRHQREMISQLDISEKQVKEAAKVKEQFLANMSHEIRTPMNAILGFTNMLQRTDLSKEQRQYVHNIQSSGDNLLSIVNDILDLSKIEAGMMRIDRVPFSLHALLHSIEIMFRQKAKQKRLYLELNINPDVPETIAGDPVRLTQILVNLLGNSMKFTRTGGIKLDVEKASQQEKEIRLRFSIKDSGIGISEDKQKSIFERFQQAEAETTRRYGGTGLGLSIVKQLIDLQNGTIHLKSEEGKGSEFIFELQYGISDSAIDYSISAIDELYQNHMLPGVRVLVAEDNEMNQQLMRHLLDRWNVKYEIALNGNVVIEKLRSTNFDLVLMDIQMPEMDGYVTTQKIRNELKSEIPVIAMTAHAMPGEKEKCLSYGMNSYISKPIKEAELFRLITLFGQNEKKVNEKITSLDYLKELSSGNTAFEKEIITQFIKQLPSELTALEHAVNENNKKNAQVIAHGMKSSVSYLGLTDRLHPLLDHIENHPESENAREIMQEVISVCNSALTEAKETLETYN